MQSHPNAQWGTACVVPMQDATPNLVRGFGEPEKLAILHVDYTLVDQEPDVEGATPILFADQHDRDRLDLASLHQGQDFEQLVQRPKATRECDERLRAQQQMHLAQGKVVKSKTQVWRDVGIGILLMWQIDIQTDGFCAGFEGSTVGGLHDARAAASHDRQPGWSAIAITAAAYQPSEFTRDLIVVTLCQNTFGHCELADQYGITGIVF